MKCKLIALSNNYIFQFDNWHIFHILKVLYCIIDLIIHFVAIYPYDSCYFISKKMKFRPKIANFYRDKPSLCKVRHKIQQKNEIFPYFQPSKIKQCGDLYFISKK